MSERSAGQVYVESIVEGEQTFVAQPHDGNADERLGDRADAVLRLHVGRPAIGPTVDVARCICPRQRAVADHSSHHGR